MKLSKIVAISMAICSTGAVASICTEITEPLERLSCYDKQAGYQSEEVSSTEVASLELNQLEEGQLQQGKDASLSNMSPSSIIQYFDDMPTFKLSPHNATYMLFASYNDKMNDDIWQQVSPGTEMDDLEVKFQLSAKMKLWDDMYNDNWDLWFGYTQTSWWQLYNSEESAPFRETNYTPEIFASYYSDLDVLGWQMNMIDIGFVHQSNGRNEPLSRSWNRIYADFNFTKDNFHLSLKPWYRIPESSNDDDNPDIDDYVGYGDYRLTYKSSKHILSFLWRNNFDFDDNRGGAEFNWAYQAYESINLYLQYYNGYGESMIDYDNYTNRISFGILIYDWL